MAAQTCSNLQAACLSGILVCLTKDVHFNPWHFGQVRLSELPIEEHFSYCRRQSSNSQLSARAFWQAAARVSLRNGKLLSQESAPKMTGEKPLTNSELLEVVIPVTSFCSDWHGDFMLDIIWIDWDSLPILSLFVVVDI